MKQVLNDLNAPRFQEPVLDISKRVLETLREEDEYFSDITVPEFKRIISTFNKTLWENIIKKKRNIRLPKNMGIIGIYAPKGRSKDMSRAKEIGPFLNYNFHTAQKMCAIKWFDTRTNKKLWNFAVYDFQAERAFKRAASYDFKKNFAYYPTYNNRESTIDRLESQGSFKHDKLRF